MKLFRLFVFIFICTTSTYSLAASQRNSSHLINHPTMSDILRETAARPYGFMGIIGGSVLFVALSPVTGLLTLLEPHNTIHNTMEILVISPVKYTFVRPVADWNHPLYGYWKDD